MRLVSAVTCRLPWYSFALWTYLLTLSRPNVTVTFLLWLCAAYAGTFSFCFN